MFFVVLHSRIKGPREGCGEVIFGGDPKLFVRLNFKSALRL